MTTKTEQIASTHQIQVALVMTAIAIPIIKKIRNWLRVMGPKVVSPFWMRTLTTSIGDGSFGLVQAWEADNE